MRREGLLTVLLGALLALSACRMRTIQSEVRSDLIADGVDPAKLGLTWKIHQPKLSICVYIDTKSNSAGQSAPAGIAPALPGGDQATEPEHAVIDPSKAGEPPAIVSKEQQLSLTRAAVLAWLDVFRPLSEKPVADAVELIEVATQSDCRDGDALVTISPKVQRAHAYPSAFPRIAIHPQGSIPPYVGTTSEQSFQYVILHEFGHAFGLGDLYVEGIGICKPDQPIEAVMCGEKVFYEPEPDDKDGIAKAYRAAYEQPTFDTEVAPDRERLLALLEEKDRLVREKERLRTDRFNELATFSREHRFADTLERVVLSPMPPEFAPLSREQADLFIKLHDRKFADKAEFDELYARYQELEKKRKAMFEEIDENHERNYRILMRFLSPDQLSRFEKVDEELEAIEAKLAEVESAIFAWDNASSQVIYPFARDKAQAGP